MGGRVQADSTVRWARSRAGAGMMGWIGEVAYSLVVQPDIQRRHTARSSVGILVFDALMKSNPPLFFTGAGAVHSRE